MTKYLFLPLFLFLQNTLFAQQPFFDEQPAGSIGDVAVAPSDLLYVASIILIASDQGAIPKPSSLFSSKIFSPGNYILSK